MSCLKLVSFLMRRSKVSSFSCWVSPSAVVFPSARACSIHSRYWLCFSSNPFTFCNFLMSFSFFIFSKKSIKKRLDEDGLVFFPQLMIKRKRRGKNIHIHTHVITLLCCLFSMRIFSQTVKKSKTSLATKTHRQTQKHKRFENWTENDKHMRLSSSKKIWTQYAFALGCANMS